MSAAKGKGAPATGELANVFDFQAAIGFTKQWMAQASLGGLRWVCITRPGHWAFLTQMNCPWPLGDSLGGGLFVGSSSEYSVYAISAQSKEDTPQYDDVESV
jgi:hypothetical protein